jgi:hypothetical protein
MVVVKGLTVAIMVCAVSVVVEDVAIGEHLKKKKKKNVVDFFRGMEND